VSGVAVALGVAVGVGVGVGLGVSVGVGVGVGDGVEVGVSVGVVVGVGVGVADSLPHSELIVSTRWLKPSWRLRWSFASTLEGRLADRSAPVCA
jgi:hypothetical protein